MAAIAESLDPPFMLRPGTRDDAGACGRICYEAFAAVAEKHSFPPDFPSAEVATELLSGLLTHPGFYSVIAEAEGRIVGSNFLDERNVIAGIGPITVDPRTQNQAVGRRLMADVLSRVADKGLPGVRLLQATYHNRSLALYTRLGFVAREPLSTLQGPPPGVELPGHRVRPATRADLPHCNRLCIRVHGHDRGGELSEAIDRGTARVVEHAGRIVGYTTLVAFFGHSVGESNDALKALIAAADEYPGPGFHVPTRNAELFRWCLENGLRVVQPMTLMSIGLYNEPAGAYLPSIFY
ncbi:GNAT family N-acetyltransferase [Pseudomonas sp. MBLB4123]|uniref:GNAT family N-acetyltransferase n=1 Tax=Pseudomonas sp. MBLB4123 TaxID=3451557 RepID=UPI003F74F0DB